MVYEPLCPDLPGASEGAAGPEAGRVRWQCSRRQVHAGPEAGRVRWQCSRRQALAACVLLGACVATVGLLARKSAALPQLRWHGSHLLGLATPGEISSLPYVDEETGQQIALSSELEARCVSEIFSAAFQLADVAVTAMAANADCGYTRRNPPWTVGGGGGPIMAPVGGGGAPITAPLMANVAENTVGDLEALMADVDANAAATQQKMEQLDQELTTAVAHVNQVQDALEETPNPEDEAEVESIGEHLETAQSALSEAMNPTPPTPAPTTEPVPSPVPAPDPPVDNTGAETVDPVLPPEPVPEPLGTAASEPVDPVLLPEPVPAPDPPVDNTGAKTVDPVLPQEPVAEPLVTAASEPVDPVLLPEPVPAPDPPVDNTGAETVDPVLLPEPVPEPLVTAASEPVGPGLLPEPVPEPPLTPASVEDLQDTLTEVDETLNEEKSALKQVGTRNAQAVAAATTVEQAEALTQAGQEIEDGQTALAAADETNEQILQDTAGSKQTVESLGNIQEELADLNQDIQQVQSGDGPERRLDQPESLYSTRRIAQTRCTRDIGWMLGSALGAGAQLTQSLPNCNPSFGPEFRRKSKCAQQVQLSLRVTSLLTAAIAMMVDGCKPLVSSYRQCSAFLELVSWIVAGAARVYSNSVQFCSHSRLGNKGSNVARCIGPVFSSMGYISAAGLNIASGSNHWCTQATIFETTATTPLSEDDAFTLWQNRARCARDHLSAARQLLFAGYRMVTAAAGCSRRNYLCHMDITRAASALLGTGQGIAQVADACYPLPTAKATSQTPAEASKYRATCAARSLGLVKILSVCISYSVEATSSCVRPNLAKSRCGASVWRAIAGLSALMQEFSEMEVNCKLNQAWFPCGKNNRWAGGSFRIFVLGFTGALLNCPLSPFREQWDATKHFNFPFWFSFP